MTSSKDVAKMAGVSQATVSRVMNNPESVKPETRKKVQDAMAKLRYQPNLIARSLVTKSSRTIALISGTLKNDFFVETTDTIVNIAASRGYSTMVYFEGGAKLQDILNSIIGYKVDGVLLSSIKLDDPFFKEIEASGIPYMLFNRRPHSGGNYVVLDNQLAGEMLARHLLELGHRRIAYISGEINISTFYERKIGFEKAMGLAKIAIDKDLVHFKENTSATEIEKLTSKLMNLPNPPTAIICATDEMALNCMNTIMAMGFGIPNDVSVAGIDDITISSHQAIQLTSVGQHKFKMGEIAVEQLIEMIEQGDIYQKPKQIVFSPELFIRQTTGPKT
ncbi:MAG: LacI family DNA-binding transcriptional regulator [Bacillota bacterium]|nr:LacI family DNA-binding transcriptional regulator [Bacillota bacterium]